MLKKSLALLLLSMALVLFAGAASAHVTVLPKETSQGAYEVFTVRVPTEKEAATVKVEVSIPEEVNITRFEPKPDWEYELTKDETGKITSVVWTATGDGLSSTEFGEFKMNGKVADDAAEIAWKAYQTYADGSVVEWVGGEGADYPASVTIANASSAGAGDGHGAAAPADAGTDSGNGSSGGGDLSLYFSIAALVISVIALLTLLLRRRPT